MERHRDECDNPLDELSPTVRKAVEAVRHQPPPPAVVNISLRQANYLQYEGLTRKLFLLLAACFVLALGVGLWAMQQHVGQAPQVALKGASMSDADADDFEESRFGYRGPHGASRPERHKTRLDTGDETTKIYGATPFGESAPSSQPMPGDPQSASRPTLGLTPGVAGQPTSPRFPELSGNNKEGGKDEKANWEKSVKDKAERGEQLTSGEQKYYDGYVQSVKNSKAQQESNTKFQRESAEKKKWTDEAIRKGTNGEEMTKEEKDVYARYTRDQADGTAKLAETLREINGVVRDQRIVRGLADLQTKKEGEGRRAGAEQLAKAIEERLQIGVGDAKEEDALRKLKDRLEEVEGIPSTDQHEKFIPNPFLRAKDSPLSTFSIDVDTASYSLMRRYLKDENRLPPRDAIRIEELVNYFDYSYPQPKGEHPIGVTPEVSTCPWNQDHRLVRIAVQAQKVDPENLPPRNLVFLIDVSGSMAPEDRLPLVKKSLGFLIDQLTEKDKVAIVVYAGSAGTALESTPGNQKEKIRQAVDGLGAGGSTNGAGGIMAAYEEAHKNFIPGGVNRVILATDGDFNVGISSQGELVRLVEEKRNKGIFLTALGYGMGNLKDTTIMKLADHGHGHYAYIDSLAEAKKVFVDDGMSLITVAKDVKIQVEFNPKMVAAYKLIGYEKRLMAAQDFNDDTKLAGVMGCGHKVTALYEVVPAGKPVEAPKVDDLRYQQPASLTKEADSGELLTVKVRYKDTLGDKSQLLLAPVSDKKEAFDKASADFRFAAAVAAYAILLRDQPANAGINLAGVAELADSAKGQDARGLRKEFVELVKKAEELSKPAGK